MSRDFVLGVLFTLACEFVIEVGLGIYRGIRNAQRREKERAARSPGGRT